MALKIGDKVTYIPAPHHAKARPNGQFPWVFGWKARGGSDGKPAIKELTDMEARNKLDFIRRSPDPAAQMKNLVLTKPNLPGCPCGTVVKIHEDGTVDADVDFGNGVTCHELGLEVDQTKSKPNTVHYTKTTEVVATPVMEAHAEQHA